MSAVITKPAKPKTDKMDLKLPNSIHKEICKSYKRLNARITKIKNVETTNKTRLNARITKIKNV